MPSRRVVPAVNREKEEEASPQPVPPVEKMHSPILKVQPEMDDEPRFDYEDVMRSGTTFTKHVKTMFLLKTSHFFKLFFCSC
jgi:hypothetical protein